MGRSTDGADAAAGARSKLLFVDNDAIEMVQDVTRVLHQPARVLDRPLIARDRPWEHITYFQCTNHTVLFDPLEGRFKCWYENWKLDARAMAGSDADLCDAEVSRVTLCYAESPDGIHWEKPPVEPRGTNTVLGDPAYRPGGFGGVHAATVLLDDDEADEDRRFKMIFQHIRADGGKRTRGPDALGAPQVTPHPIRLATSADGRRWRVDERTLHFGDLGPRLGDVLALSREEATGRYVLHTRHPEAWNPSLRPTNPRTGAWSLPYYPGDASRMNKRRIFRCHSDDLICWTEPALILGPDDETDNLDESYYGMRIVTLEDGCLGLLNIFHAVANTTDVRLIWRRDGGRWRPLDAARPFFGPGPEGAWDGVMVFMSNPVIERGDALWFYYAGANCHHDWWITGGREGLTVPEAHDLSRVAYGLGLATLRRDGYASLHAGPVREGLVITRPVAFGRGKLALNAACGSGGGGSVNERVAGRGWA